MFICIHIKIYLERLNIRLCRIVNKRGFFFLNSTQAQLEEQGSWALCLSLRDWAWFTAAKLG